uniref:EOG090X09EK n=1 Tax=Lynceus sp. MCZ IZ 141354 TaxID=1930659 RepID=A0A9N6WYN3_9CRUS|nr:EOG090X09EK [Lynceus sp. MCZ IZ 141354]
MKVLRHEEFEEGCKAACNGPYDGKWSKTMIGYGSEDNHFVIELTYNYGLSSYKLGNDFLGITIQNQGILEKAAENVLEAPGGYKFQILDEKPSKNDPVVKVSLACSNLEKSVNYWHDLLKMKIYEKEGKKVLLGYSDDQAKLELIDIGEKVDHAKAFGRIAFSCPASELSGIEELMKSNKQTILTPLVSLDTPGKATVQVVILADPDGHEICFVGDEAFRELSQVDPNADSLLEEAMNSDKSDEWFAKKGKSKGEA